MAGKRKLTKTIVEAVVPPEKGQTLVWDSVLQGLGLRVTAGGAKSYIAEARVIGKTRRVTLGRHGVITAEQARQKAKTELGKMAAGADPSADKKRQKARSVTLEAVIEAYLAIRRTRDGRPLKERTKADIRYHLKSSFASWRQKPVAEITREMIQRRYSDLAKRSVAQANQAMRVLGAIMNYAAASYRAPDGVRIITDNPVDVLREANMLRSVRPKTNMVPLDRIGEWWSAVHAMRSEPAPSAASRSASDLVALLALTGLRLGEARSLRWEQLNLTECSLTLTDTKNRTDVILPLSDAAAELIKSRPEESSYIFPPRSSTGKLPHLKDCRTQLAILGKTTGINITAHDLRRTYRAVAAELGIELWRTKALMNHKQTQDVTLHHYADLSDVRSLKPSTDLISNFFEDRRCAYENGEV